MDCELMLRIATFQPLIYLLFYLVIISIIGVPLVTYVSIRIARNRLYHLNTRIILVAHGIGIIIHSIDRVILHSSDLYRWLIILPQSSTPCDIYSSSERCFSLRLFLNCGMWFDICTTPTVVIERLIATRRISNYQNDKSLWRWMIIFQMCLSSFLLLLLYSGAKFGIALPYCMAVKDKNSGSKIPLSATIIFAITSVIQTISIIIFRYLIKKNEKLRESLHKEGSELNKRYHVEESLRSLRTMSPAIHIMCLFQFSHGIVTFFLLNYSYIFSQPLFYFAMEITAFLPIYAIFYAIAVIYQEKLIVKLNLKSLKNKIDIQPETYFDHYKDAWMIE